MIVFTNFSQIHNSWIIIFSFTMLDKCYNIATRDLFQLNRSCFMK